MKRSFTILLLVLLCGQVFANVRLPRVFGSSMVLQRDKPIVIWGWADPKEKVTVTFHGKSKTVATSKDGSWKVTMDAEKAGGPYTLSVKGENALELTDVLVGDVWICSGQSNMEWTVRNSNNPDKEISDANFPTIRHFKVPNIVASEPKNDFPSGDWKVCSPETVGDFTAVGYFFARELTRELNVPIGLINTSWGGTHSETWTSREAFESSNEFREMITGMPKLNLDSLARQKNSAMLARLNTLQGPVASAVEIDRWKNNLYNDSEWKSMKAPGQWESQELGDFDGVVWFRKSFEMNAGDAGKEAVVKLAMIDDSDVTYLNGVKVGSMEWKWNEQRVYKIPAGTLKAGTNVIAVRVEDTGGGGGFHGDAADMAIKLPTSTIPLAGEWKWRVESLGSASAGVGPNSYPTLLFNAMLNPLFSLSIKGALWYQGESNAGRAYQYRQAFPLMIKDWRAHFKQGDFPFYFVQLSSFNSANGTSEWGSTWAELREAQTLTLSLPNTGMAVTTDIGNPTDIHPRNKQDVGKRLAAIALNKTYGKQRVDSGPTFKAMRTEGDRAIVTFENTGSGLATPDKYGDLRGFELAGADKKFHYARALIQDNTVVISCNEVKQPVAVRYSWADDASESNLFNKEGFPAAPFRTDQWPGITENGKFTIGY